MNNFAELSKKLSLLEVATIEKYRDSANIDGDGYITGVNYWKAYKPTLKERYPFDRIDWDTPPFSDFRILKEAPPKRLKMTDNGPEFVDVASVDSWGVFISGFCQLRNNLVHGAKFLHSMGLDERDQDLIKAGLSFIKFIEDEQFVLLQ